ncbi:MAG TPA: integrase core domain-containing protein, partial [Puia sp.]|nr:integrase core domain-containing protein [Puia sp.]
RCLPDELHERIPRSTRFDWSRKELNTTFGFEWASGQHQRFETLQQVVTSKKLLRVNLALLRIIAIKRFLHRYASRLSGKEVQRVVLGTIEKVCTVIKLPVALKYIQHSACWYQRLKTHQRCASSPSLLCRLKHPGQLLVQEINAIKTYCSENRFLTWPLASVYHQLRRDKAAAFQLSTFYKYVGLLQLKRQTARSRRKHHTTGIRAQRPFAILHADLTVFRTADNVKNYVYLVQDNFSRAILAVQVSLEYSARITLQNVEWVREQYLVPAGITECRLITDDGVENFGVVSDYLGSVNAPSIRHLVAQKDIVFSNSMIEAANKQLKYRFLYHQHIIDHKQLRQFVEQAIHDYNNRPHHELGGLTPMEVLHGARVDKAARSHEIRLAQQQRLLKNKREKCCFPTF